MATCEDLATLAQLAEEAVAEQVDQRGGAVWAWRETRPLPALPSLEASLGDEDQLLLAGTLDEVVVGYAGARVERLRSDDLLGVISDLYVEPGARGVGVGEALVEEVLDWCRGRGCCGVDAVALPGNRDTKNFFETFGFTARAIIVHRRLVAGLAVESG